MSNFQFDPELMEMMSKSSPSEELVEKGATSVVSDSSMADRIAELKAKKQAESDTKHGVFGRVLSGNLPQKQEIEVYLQKDKVNGIFTNYDCLFGDELCTVGFVTQHAPAEGKYTVMVESDGTKYLKISIK